MQYVNNNGILLPTDSPVINAGSRAYLYGDGVFESVRIRDGKPINLENHVKRLLEGAKVLKLRPSTFYSTSFC